MTCLLVSRKQSRAGSIDLAEGSGQDETHQLQYLKTSVLGRDPHGATRANTDSAPKGRGLVAK